MNGEDHVGVNVKPNIRTLMGCFFNFRMELVKTVPIQTEEGITSNWENSKPSEVSPVVKDYI